MAFVTRSGSQLLLNGQPFRFGGANLPWLGRLSIAAYPTHAEIDNGLTTAAHLGITVVRSHTLGISVGDALALETSLGVFNAAAFDPIDYAIYKAGVLGLKLIIPLTDSNNFFPGWMGTFTGWEGVATNVFYTNAAVISDFETYISTLLTHVNAYNGLALKDDPTIMLWETGNELNATGGANTNWIAWTTTIATFIKSLAPNQLVLDGFYYTDANNLSSHLDRVANAHTDANSSHYYNDTMANYSTAMVSDATACAGPGKVFIVGEYDWTSASGTTSDLLTWQTTIESTSAVTGNLFWSFYPNDASGNPVLNNNDAYTNHYPGLTKDMRIRTSMLGHHAWLMSGKTSLPSKFSSFSAHI